MEWMRLWNWKCQIGKFGWIRVWWYENVRELPKGGPRQRYFPTPSEQREQSKNAKWRMQVVNRKDNIQTFTPKIIIMGGTKLGPQKTHRTQKKRDRTQPKPPIRGTRLREKRAINMIKNVHIIIIKCYRAQTKNPRGEGKKKTEKVHTKLYKEEKGECVKIVFTSRFVRRYLQKAIPSLRWRHPTQKCCIDLDGDWCNGIEDSFVFCWFASRCGI